MITVPYTPPHTPPPSNFFLCFTCGRQFKSSRGLTQHTRVYRKEVAKGNYKCIFHGDGAYQILSEILNSDQWGKKGYSQKQETYVVCLNPTPWNSNSHDQSEEIDPLEQLIHQQSKNYKKTRRPKFSHRKILVEWKKRVSREINGNLCTAGYIYFNFYISQSFVL
ncbi:hypothetical protein GLOIN_2v1836763 [Rhizophagus irregularis DAOM 181602=DAOM 197198]|nr:hypothetical protein GLOIN_2v1836763 [Rhizophagus irregularis DAOM 181602=DAOM 197198]